MQKHWPPMRCPKHFTWLFQQAAIPLRLFFSTMLQIPAFNDGLDVSSDVGIPRRGTFAVYVRARAITCPIFQCFVCLYEIVSTNCQSSCIPKHSYMHNHASYVFMHLIKLSCHSYIFAFSIPMSISIKVNLVDFKFLLPTTNVYYHVNFKVQQSCQHSCQIQAPAVMSIKFKSFSSTICFWLSVKRPVRIQEQLVPILLVYAERQVRIQEQLVLLLFLLAK